MGIKFPAGLNDVKRFESNNPDVSINVYETYPNATDDTKGTIILSRRTNKPFTDDLVHINLLLIKQDDVSHYVYI